jgi:hypothetical protein
MTAPVEAAFTGTFAVGDAAISVDSVLCSPEFASLHLQVHAGFGYVGHIPPRIYLWLRGRSEWFFLKIGKASELPVFANEFTFSRLVRQDESLLVTPCLELVRGAGWVGLLVAGLSPEQLSRRRCLAPLEVLRSALFALPRRGGPFGGVVHCDLGSNNVYWLDNRVWVCDWEMASASAPHFCDAICLATAVAAGRGDGHVLRTILHEECGILVQENELHSALRFLATRGNRAAGRAIVRLASAAS